MSVDYGSTSVQYEWNGSGWERTQDGEATVDTDGVRTAPTTVVLQFVRYVPSRADPASPEAVTVSADGGPAWVLTDGHLVETTWTRETAADRTDYKLSSGSEVTILPGPIWIELPRDGRVSTN